MNEYEIIRSVAGKFPRSRWQRNEVFTSDAELIQIGDQLWALTIDEFTPEEDLFSCDDPQALGANLATATLSDLLASGAEPAFFMDVLCLPGQPRADFVAALSAGIRSVLDQAGCFLCGGDMGRAETWRFCGFAMGPVPDNKPLTHILTAEPQVLWVTGQLGDANLAAFQGHPTPGFELRLKEAELIRRYGTACIDTSGGFLDAVWLLHTLSPGLRMAIDCERLPLAPGIPEFTRTSKIPEGASLLGGAGEYELLFATPAEMSAAAQTELTAAGATPVGTAQPHYQPGVYLNWKSEVMGVMSGPPPCPRQAATVGEHVEQVMRMAEVLFGTRPTDPGERASAK